MLSLKFLDGLYIIIIILLALLNHHHRKMNLLSRYNPFIAFIRSRVCRSLLRWQVSFLFVSFTRLATRRYKIRTTCFPLTSFLTSIKTWQITKRENENVKMYKILEVLFKKSSVWNEFQRTIKWVQNHSQETTNK